MNSLNFSNFLFERVSETISQRRYIEEVSIDFGMGESFGNEYIRVDYKVKANQDFYNLPKTAQEAVFNHKPQYIFTLSTHAEYASERKKKKLLKIVEFKSIYESLAVYVALQLEHALNPEAIVKIKGIDFWPEANYAEKYLDSALYLKDKNYKYNSFEFDVLQWDSLHKLANNSKKTYAKSKSYFGITDHKISELFELDLNTIRFIVLNHTVPIKIKGSKTIEEVHIHTLLFVEALKAKIRDKDYSREIDVYRSLVTYLYDNFLPLERSEIIERQKSDFLGHFVIQNGDILQLKDGRIVIADLIQIDAANVIAVEYLNLKVNLEAGERKRKTPLANISYVLSQQDFLSYKDYTPSRRISLLNKWMLKKKIKVEMIRFEPDLT